jgi:hypothetical protein
MEDLLLLCLDQDISFRTLASPSFRDVTGVRVNRNALSALATTMRVSVDKEIKNQLSMATHCALTFDEWTDVAMLQYVGVKAHVTGPDGHHIYCLDHWPLREDSANAANLARIIEMIITKFVIRRILEFVVTDTTNVMPLTVRTLKLSWMPCWGHVINLMLCDIIAEVRGDIQPIMNMVSVVSGSTKWTKLVRNGRYATLPTYTSTRWYSVHRLTKNSLNLRVELTQFISEMPDEQRRKHEIPDSTWTAAQQLLPVFGTFRNAVELLEVDAYGSLSHVFEAVKMIGPSVQAPIETYKALAVGWEKAKQHWMKFMANGDRGPIKTSVLLAVMTNPGVDARSCLSPADYAEAETALRDRFRDMQVQIPDSPIVETDHSTRAVTRKDLLRRNGSLDELEVFLSLDRVLISDEDDYDVHEWWVLHRKKFPNILCIAQQYLIIPATSAAAERQFSRAKRLKSDKRHSINPLKASD